MKTIAIQPVFPSARRSFLKPPLAVLVVGLVLFAGRSAHAANATWNGGTDDTWANAANWSTSPVPGAGNAATFNNAGDGFTTIDLGSGVTINGITFDNTSGLLGNYTLGSGAAGSETLTLGNNNDGILLNSNVVTDQLINAEIIIGTTGRITGNLTNNSASALLTVAGPITGSASVSGGLGLQINGTGDVDITGVISNGTDGDGIALTKGSTGTLTLSGANTFTGNLTLTSGTVQVAGADALGTTTLGTISVGNGSITTSSLLTTGAYTVANNIQVNGNTTFTVGSSQTSGTSTYSGTVNLAAGTNNTVTFYAATGGTAAFTGVVSGSSSNLTVAGGGTVTLSAVNTYSGSTTVSSGTTLALTSSGTISSSRTYVIDSGATFDVSNKLSYSFTNIATTIDIGASSSGWFNAGTIPVTFSATTSTLTLDFTTPSLTNGQTYDLFTFGSKSGDFESVTLSGSLSGSLSDTGGPGIWTGMDSGSLYNFTFNESTGVLSVASAIPEPATYGLIGGTVVCLGAFWFRRRRQIVA